MHQTGMFNRTQTAQPTAPAVEVYDVNAIANQFSSWNFGVGQPYDQHTPQITVMTIQEIQQHALQGHAIRVGAFNVLSENAFNNPAFQDLVYTIIMRLGHGMTAGEWRNLDTAVQTVVARSVKSCASAMAASDPEFMTTLTPRDAVAVRENAEIWNYLLALAQGQANYVPFNQMGTGGSGLSNIGATTQDAMTAARSLRGSTAGAFVESSTDYGVTSTRYNNDASPTVGRYGRRAEKMFGKMEGSMQEALQGSGATEQTKQPSNYQSRMTRPNATQGGQATTSPQAVQKFDSDVTDFSKSMNSEESNETIVEMKKEPLFTVQMGGVVVKIIRERKEGVEAWKTSSVQRFHPAWCTRTHSVRYFEAQDGIVIAVLQEFTEEQKEIAMNYDAHAVDPTKGQPEPDVPVKTVRKEAQVLYVAAEKVKVNISIAKNFSMEEDVSGAIRSTRLIAEMSQEVPDAYIKSAIINAPLVYPTVEDAKEDAIVLRAIAGSKDFVEAASYMSKIRNALARNMVNEALVQAINRATECELGVGVRISNFEEDGPEIIGVLENTQGAFVSEKMRANQSALLTANVRIVTAVEIQGHAEATLVMEDQDGLSEDLLNRILFLQQNVCVVWVNFTDNELAVGIPPKGPAVIQADSLGALHKIAQTVFTEGIGSLGFSEQYLVTKDNVRYRLHRGLINRDCYLLSKSIK